MSNEERAKTLGAAPIKVTFNSPTTTLNIRSMFNVKPSEDVYYDEVVYYDGGGVEGYGEE